MQPLAESRTGAGNGKVYYELSALFRTIRVNDFIINCFSNIEGTTLFMKMAGERIE